MQKNEKNQRVHIPYASRRELIAAICLSFVDIAAMALLLTLTDIPPVIPAVAISAIFLLEMILLTLRVRSRVHIAPAESIHALMNEEGSVVFRTTDKPVITFDRSGKVLWYNDALRDVLPPETNFVGRSVSDALGVECSADNFTGFGLSIDDRRFEAEGFLVSDYDSGLYLLTLTEVTALARLEEK